MRIGLVNIALELFKNKKFSSINNILDMGSKEMRFSYDQLKYAFDQSGIKFNKKKFEKLKQKKMVLFGFFNLFLAEMVFLILMLVFLRVTQQLIIYL